MTCTLVDVQFDLPANVTIEFRQLFIHELSCVRGFVHQVSKELSCL